MKRFICIFLTFLCVALLSIPSFAVGPTGYNPKSVSYVGGSIGSSSINYNISVWSESFGTLCTSKNYDFSDSAHKNGFYKVDCSDTDDGKLPSSGFTNVYFDYRYINNTDSIKTMNWIQLDFSNLNIQNTQGYLYIDLSMITYKGSMIGASLTYTDSNGSQHASVPVLTDNIHTKTIKVYHSISQADFVDREIEVCYAIIDITDIVTRDSTLNTFSLLIEAPIIPISESFYNQLGEANAHVNYKCYVSQLFVQSVSADVTAIINYLDNPSQEAQIILNARDEKTKELVARIKQYNDYLFNMAMAAYAPSFTVNPENVDVSLAKPYISWTYDIPIISAFFSIVSIFAIGSALIFGRN